MSLRGTKGRRIDAVEREVVQNDESMRYRRLQEIDYSLSLVAGNVEEAVLQCLDECALRQGVEPIEAVVFAHGVEKEQAMEASRHQERNQAVDWKTVRKDKPSDGCAVEEEAGRTQRSNWSPNRGGWYLFSCASFLKLGAMHREQQRMQRN